MMKKSVWTKALVVGLLVGFTGSPAMGNDLTPAESESMREALPRTDPRSVVDPVLVALPEAEVPAPTGKKMSKRRAMRMEGYDIASGRSKRERSKKAVVGGEHLAAEATGAAAQEGAAPAEMTRDASPFGPEVIWDYDDRVRITPTTSYPWRAQVKLFTTFRNGVRVGCSGTLISPRYIITAGHCVHNAANGGFAYSVQAIPGYDNGYQPYGSAYATYVRSLNGWIYSSLPEYDLGIITLDRSIGNTVGWFGWGSFSNTTLSAASANLSGYPGDKCYGACQYYDFDPFYTLLPLTVHYRTDTFDGQSGSGVYIFYNGGRYVVAAHRGTCAGSSVSNCGVRIQGGVYSYIQSSLNSGY